MITQAEIKSILSYDEKTGDLTWLRQTGPRGTVGSIAGSIDAYGYRNVKINGHSYKAHRLVWLYHTGEFPGGELDHVNVSKLDNRIENLRVATRSENIQNTRMRADNTTGFRGVVWHKSSKRWVARASVNGVRKFICASPLKEIAVSAYEAFAKDRFNGFYNSGTV
jgi:hypothetical protein